MNDEIGVPQSFEALRVPSVAASKGIDVEPNALRSTSQVFRHFAGFRKMFGWITEKDLHAPRLNTLVAYV